MSKEKSIYFKLFWSLIFLGILPRIYFSVAYTKYYDFIHQSFFWAIPVSIILMWPLLLPIPRKLAIRISFIPAALFSLFDILHISVYETLPIYSVFHAIFETYIAEAIEFVVDYTELSQVIIITGFTLFSVFLFKRVDRAPIRKTFFFGTKGRPRLTFWVLFLASCIWLTFVLQPKNKYIRKVTRRTAIGSVVAFIQYLDKSAEYEERLQVLEDIDVEAHDVSNKERATHVLILGESLGRHHMSLYGYPRQTNPELEKMRNDLLIMNNAWSAYPNTVDALKSILTFVDLDHNSPDRLISLVKIMKSAGYKTFWISNQIPMDKRGSIATSLGHASDEKKFLNFGGFRKPHFDEDIFEPLEKFLKDEANKKFIVIHLYGNHAKYNQRYTKDFEKFKGGIDGKSEKHSYYINEYDNSVMYNDFIVSRLFKLMKSKNTVGTATYLPDHGEEVYDFRDLKGHTPATPSTMMFNIPLLLWGSQEFVRDKVYSAIEKNRDTYFVSDDLIHTLIELYEIKTPLFNPSKSLSYPNYQHRPLSDYYDFVDLKEKN